jgi:pimeloyl-ACP methyl ester carboxylesterase
MTNVVSQPTTIGTVRIREEDPEQTFEMYYELHGDRNAPHKCVLIMGLNSTLYSWTPFQSSFFSQKGWQCLIFDNRGVGKSGYPKGKYKTSEMAMDTWQLMQKLEFTQNIFVMGVRYDSM